MTDLEDALKRLDKLTQEEARMALAEVLRITNDIHDDVKIIDSKVDDIGDKLQSMDNKVQVVINRARAISSQSFIHSNAYTFRWRGDKSSHDRSKISYPADSKHCGRNQVFVI